MNSICRHTPSISCDQPRDMESSYSLGISYRLRLLLIPGPRPDATTSCLAVGGCTNVLRACRGIPYLGGLLGRFLRRGNLPVSTSESMALRTAAVVVVDTIV